MVEINEKSTKSENLTEITENRRIFLENTINPDLFQIDNVENDNACFYRAVANYLYFALPQESVSTLRKLDTKKWGTVKKIETVMENYGRYSPSQDKLARVIQKRIVNFIKKHKDHILDETGMSIRNSIELIHDISIDEYLDSYNTFAGDIDILDIDDDISDDYTIDRWGSIIEQSVISQILECPVIVFNSQKFDNRYNKIVNGKILKNKAEKDVRLRLSSISGRQFFGKLPIFLLWREYHNNGHYLVCYPKDISDIYDQITL